MNTAPKKKEKKRRAPQSSEKHKPARICARDDCENALKPRQNKYCCRTCFHIQTNDQKQFYPQKYKTEYAGAKLEEYLENCKEGNEAEFVPTDSSYIVRENAKLPTKEGYAYFLEVDEKTISNWEYAHPEFARAMEKLMYIQKELLTNNGLAGRYNPVITKVMLSVNHGVVERKQVDNTHKFAGVVKHLYDRADELEQQGFIEDGGDDE